MNTSSYLLEFSQRNLNIYIVYKVVISLLSSGIIYINKCIEIILNAIKRGSSKFPIMTRYMQARRLIIDFQFTMSLNGLLVFIMFELSLVLMLFLDLFNNVISNSIRAFISIHNLQDSRK